LRVTSEANAAGAVALGQAVDDDGHVFGVLQLQRAHGPPPVVDELAVNLVGDQEQPVLPAERRHHRQLFGRVDGAGRVVGVADDHEACPPSECELERLLRGHPESTATAARDRDDVQAGHGRERAVVRVERLDDENVVALVRAGDEGEKNRFAATGRRQDLVGCEVETQAARVVMLQRFQVLRGSAGWGVCENLGLDLPQARAHARRGLDVGLADVEVIHVRAARFCRVGERREPANRRGRHQVRTP
jgi:hypothetical protein